MTDPCLKLEPFVTAKEIVEYCLFPNLNEVMVGIYGPHFAALTVGNSVSLKGVI